MPQSLSCIYLHLVFSTRDRLPTLADVEIRNWMHSYLGGISGKLQCPTLVVGGTEDHVHLLARMSRTINASDWVRELKRASSKAAKERVPGFGWQDGYGVFSIGRTEVETVRRYIQIQEEHHRKWSFKDELRQLLEEHGMAYDEKYLWE